MTKKRKLSSSSPVKVEIKEENMGVNDYILAKGRLKGVLKQLTERSDSEDSDSSDDNMRSRSERKRRSDMPAPIHHTYVMKLFDRSVDLARYEEDTPLYPICRAWMQNQPRNQQPIVKRRVSSPEPSSWNNNSSGQEVHRLPPALSPFKTRIPSPLPEQQQNIEEINLNYDEKPPVDKNVLIRNHLQRWVKVKKNWLRTAAKNEDRYKLSMLALQDIYNKAQDNVD